MNIKVRDGEQYHAGSTEDLIAGLYHARQADFATEQNDSLADLIPPEQLDNIDQAVNLLLDAIKSDKKITIAGDFDADGATSCALLMKAFRMFSCTQLNFIVPNRFKFGYGLSPEIVDIIAENKPDLLITVDSGISCFSGIKRAKELGMTVLVTDHHLPGDTLPNADVFINPNLKGSTFPSKNLAGVGVAFYLMLAVERQLIQTDWFQAKKLTKPDLTSLLDLVALGTVADVVPLDRNNRILVREGIKKIRNGEASPGIEVLTQFSQRQTNILTSGDLGFALGPRLNAAGRLKDMSIGIQCLLADEHEKAEHFAQELNELNATRRNIESDMKEDASQILENMQLDGEKSVPNGIALYNPSWHQGVIGILASRLKDTWKRPIAIFTRSEANGELKGSTRSIPGIHIRDVLNEIKTFHPDAVISFGGHAMAAGISIPEPQFELFAKQFDLIITEKMKHIDATDATIVDCQLPADLINIQTAEAINTSGPWGQCFPEPLFEGQFNIIAQRIVGEHHLRLTLSVINEPVLIDAIKFYFDQDLWPNYDCNRVHIVYRLTINEYRGIRKPQLVIEKIEPAKTKRRTPNYQESY
jgi:single-stranded-DNA-specific exonuclease